MKLNFVCFLWLSIFPITIQYKILFISPLAGYSHANFLGKLADILTAAGHNVTVLQPIVVEELAGRPLHRITKDVRLLKTNEHVRTLSQEFLSFSGGDMWTVDAAGSGTTKVIQSFMKMMRAAASELLDNTVLMDELRRENFDIGIAEPINYFPFAIFDLVGIKSTLLALSLTQWEPVSEAIGEPLALSYVPTLISSYTDKMGFFERLGHFYEYYCLISPYKEEYQLEFDIIGKHLPMDNYQDLFAKASYMFTNSNPYLDFAKPSIDKVVPIGGISTDELLRTQLPEEFEQILSLRERTVLVSFGSIARSMLMPDSYKQAILSTFASFPKVTFIWKYEDENDRFAENVTNVVLTTWTPQAALLADPRVAAFVTHCGLGSLNEVVSPGKPALVVPLFADQMRNGNMLVKQGTAISLTKYDLADERKLKKAIDALLNDKRYANNAQRISEMVQSQPNNARETFVRHVEFAARFGPIKNLDPHGRHLNLFQYYLVDVAVFIAAITSIIFFVAYKLCSFFLRVLFPFSSKLKSD